MINSLKRLAAGLLIAVLLVGTFSVTNAEAAMAKPGNCRFVKWNNTKFTSCRIAWNNVSAANYYEIQWTWTDGSHWKHQYQYGDTNYIDITGLDYDHVYIMKVRSLLYNESTGAILNSSDWSNAVYSTPWPRSVSGSLKSASDVKLSWNKIKGSNGYNIALATNPNGTWRWNQSTDTSADDTSCHIKKFNGSSLKTYQNYYFRIITRRRQNGSWVSVPTPYSGYYSGRFYLYVKMTFN